MKTSTRRTAAAGLFLLGSFSFAVHAQLSFTPLGDLPGGLTNSAAYGVSSDGQVVVGSSSASTSGVSAFMWTEAGGLVALPTLAGGASSTAYAVSTDGLVVVGASGSASGPQACIWSNGAAAGLGDLAGGSFHSAALDVSDNGGVIVGYGTSVSGREAFRWTGGVMTGLGDLAGGSYQSEAKAVSPDGSRVTGYGTVSGQNVFTWDETNGMQDVYASAIAYDISADGNNLAGNVNASFIIPEITTIQYHRAARWSGGTPNIIGPEITGTGSQYDSLFYGLTPDASIAVGSYKTSSSGPYFAVSHDSINSIRNLKTVLTNGGIDMTGWELTAATAISADGSVIVGYGTNPDGNQEAWVITGYGLDLMLRWIGNTYHWPGNESLTETNELWINTDSKDPDIAVTGLVTYTTDKGETWITAPLTEGTPGPDYDHWYCNLGAFPAGTTIRYSVAVDDAEGAMIWDNNSGKDYYAVVSPGFTGPVGWVGNDGANGTIAHETTNIVLDTEPEVALDGIDGDGAHLTATGLKPDYPYVLAMGSDFENWTDIVTFTPAETNDSLSVTNVMNPSLYRLNAEDSNTYVTITREVWPQDSGKAARLGYNISGSGWQAVEMDYAGQVGNNDLWTRRVGPLESGDTVEYFIEVVSASGGGLSYFDNNDNSNYSITVP